MTARPQLRVLTLNVHKGFGVLNRRFMLHDLRHAVRRIDADLVFLQEVQGLDTLRPLRNGGLSQPHYEFLADTLWPQYAYGRNAVYPHGHHGNAVLSKYPIIEQHNHDVSIGSHEARGLLYCKLRLPEHGLVAHAICVHLGLFEGHRRQQIELLCELLRKLRPTDAPAVVAGDFNDWRNTAHRVLADCAGLEEVFVRHHGRAAKTFPAGWPLLRLDRIYLRGAHAHRAVVLPRQPWARLSDHAPLAAEVTL